MGKVGKGLFVFFISLSTAASAADTQGVFRIFDGQRFKKDAVIASAIAGSVGALGALSIAAHDINQVRTLKNGILDIRHNRVNWRTTAKAYEEALKVMEARNPLKPGVRVRIMENRNKLMDSRETVRDMAQQIRSVRRDFALRVINNGLKGAAIAGIAAAAASFAPAGGDEKKRTALSIAFGVSAAIAANLSWQSGFRNTMSWRSLGMAAIIGLASSTITAALRN